MPQKFDAESHIVTLNELRIQLDSTPFSDKDIREKFRICGIPSNPIFWIEFRKSGILKRIGNNLYCFIDPKKPIHFKMLQEIYKRYRERMVIYQSTWNNKRKRKDVLKNPEIQSAIKLLNANGFEVVQRIVLNG